MIQPIFPVNTLQELDVTDFLKRYKDGERDFPYINLSNAKLHGVVLNGIKLEYSKLNGVDLSRAIITIDSAYSISANLSHADLSDANLSYAHLSGTYIRRALLSRANLSNARLYHSTLCGTNFSRANLRCADLERSKLSNCSFHSADLRGADLYNTKLRSVCLKKAFFDKKTIFPKGFSYQDAKEAGMIFLEIDYENPLFIEQLLSDKREEKNNTPARPGQKEFSETIREVYSNRCAISGCDVTETLEAAHILPYKGDHSHKIWNGLLLRSDIHKLFDSYLLTIEPETKKILWAPSLQNSYSELMKPELKLCLPQERIHWPNEDALKWKYNEYKKRNWLV